MLAAKKISPNLTFHGDLVCKYRKIVGKTDSKRQIGNSMNIVHAWLLIQIWLITLLPSLIARRWVGPHAKGRLPL